MPRLGIVSGLDQEIQCLWKWRDDGIDVACAGADAQRAERLAGGMAEQGCQGLVSFGIAGALSGDLATGDVLLPHTVVSGEQRWTCCPAWRDRVEALLSGELKARTGVLAGSRCSVTTTAAKIVLHRATGGDAVDMESQGVAAAAAGRRLPFVAIRVIADPLDQEIPEWVPSLVEADGRVRYSRALVAALMHPGDLREVDGLRRQNRTALAVLRRVAAIVAPGFAFAQARG